MRRVIFVSVWLAALCSILTATPAAATKYVKWNAPGPTHDGSSWCNAYLTIQAALDVAADSEIVKVAAASGGTTYTEKIVFKTGAILQGGYRGNCPSTPPDGTRNKATYVTVIDGGANTAGSKTVTSFANGTIDGFTVKGAETALYISTSFTTSGNTILNGATYGIYIVDSSPTVTGNTIDGGGTGQIGVYYLGTGGCNGYYSWCNTCSGQMSANTVAGWTVNAIKCTVSGGRCSYDSCTPVCNPTISGNQISGGDEVIQISSCNPTVSNNNISGEAGKTSAVSVYNAGPTVTGNKITTLCKTGVFCSAQSGCSGYYSWCGTCTALISGNVITDASQYGVLCTATATGCSYNSCEADCRPTVSNNTILRSGIHGIQCRRATPTITGNTIADSADCGVYCYNDVSGASMLSLTIDGNVITGQKKGIYSKGVSVTGKNNIIQLSSEESVLCDGGSASVVTDNEIYGGTVGVKAAGTIAVQTSPQILRNIITGQREGGVVCQNSSSSVKDNLLASAGQYGVDCRGGSALIYNNTIVKNAWYGIWVESAAGGFPKVFNNIVSGSPCGINVDSGTPALGYNDFWNNDTNYCGITGPEPATDIHVDAMFLAPAVGEYHLLPGSPCIGVGDNTKVTAGDKDADGKARILPVGGVVDMGSFEWDNTAYWVRLARQAKVIPAQYGIEMKNKAISAMWTNSLYLEDYDRKAGIRIEKSGHGLVATNLRATAVGAVQTNADGERTLVASTVTAATGNAVITALGMNGRWLGGGSFLDPATGIGQAGMTGVFGLNNIGLLVRVWGRVTAVDTTWFKIDDGSGRQIKCVAEDGSPVVNPAWLGHYATVTGASSSEYDGANLVSKIRLIKGVVPVIYD